MPIQYNFGIANPPLKRSTISKAIKETMAKTGAPAVSTPSVEFEMTPEFKACRLIGEGMTNDSTIRSELCPKCGGGTDKEKSFSISRDSGGYTYWRCFRASCGYKGSTGGGGKGKRAQTREVNEFKDAVVPLSEEQVDFFSDEFGIDHAATNISWVPNRDAFAFKIKAPNGATIGYHLRRYDGGQPKATSYPANKALPFIAAYPASPDYGVVVVEDCLSALKVMATGVYSFALLGTFLDHERAYAIREVSPHLILALDRGTLPLALSYRDKFGDLFDKVTVWTLDKDLKYVTLKRIGLALTLGKTDFLTST